MDPANTLSVKRVPIDSIHLDAANARLHPETNLDAIAASLKRFGQQEPLIIQKSSGRVIAGNGRMVAMKQLGWRECDVVEADVDDLTATALGIALNRTASLAEWDEPVLAKLLVELEKGDAREGVGYSQDELETLLAELADANMGDYDEDAVPEPMDDAISAAGDIWLVGDHRAQEAAVDAPRPHHRGRARATPWALDCLDRWDAHPRELRQRGRRAPCGQGRGLAARGADREGRRHGDLTGAPRPPAW